MKHQCSCLTASWDMNYELLNCVLICNKTSKERTRLRGNQPQILSATPKNWCRRSRAVQTCSDLCQLHYWCCKSSGTSVVPYSCIHSQVWPNFPNNDCQFCNIFLQTISKRSQGSPKIWTILLSVFGFPGGKGVSHPRKQCKTKATRAGPSSKLPDSLAPKKN